MIADPSTLKLGSAYSATTCKAIVVLVTLQYSCLFLHHPISPHIGEEEILEPTSKISNKVLEIFEMHI